MLNLLNSKSIFSNLQIEEYGKLVAWKVDSHFAIVLETDVTHFTKLIMATFMQDRFSVNDHLPLIRIECTQNFKKYLHNIKIKQSV